MPLYHIRYIAFVCAVLSGLLHASAARGGTQHLYSIHYKDSIELESGSRILSNTITLQNNFRNNISMGVQIKLPPYWRLIGKLDEETLNSFFLRPGEKRLIPLSLLQTNSVRAGWDSIKVTVWSFYTTDTVSYFIRIKVQEKPAFQVLAEDPEQDHSPQNPDTLSFAVRVKNTGNTEDRFQISGSNEAFSYRLQSSFQLPSGGDTMLHLSIPVRNKIWKAIQEESIPLSIRAEKAKGQKELYFKVRKVNSFYAARLPPRKEIPFTIGGGMMLNGLSYKYFGQFSTQLNLNGHFFSLSYRTEDFGTVAYSYQPNAFNLSYGYKHFQIAAGQIQGPKNFFTFGQGVRLQYNKGGTYLALSGLLHNDAVNIGNNRALENDNLFALLRYRLKKVEVEHQLESNFNSYYGINSYLLHNEIGLIASQHTRLKLFVGIGMEEKQRDVGGVDKTTEGWTAGYSYYTLYKTWQLTSDIRFRSSSYPGIYQGQHYENHELRKYFGKTYVAATGYIQAIQRNALRDTLYNSDFLSTNATKYGLGLGRDGAKLSPWIGFGALMQGGRQFAFNTAAYIDGVLRWTPGKSATLDFISNNAVSQDRGADVFSTNTQLQFSSKHIGFNGYYNRTPQNGDLSTSYTQTVNGGPNISYTFFGGKLRCFFRYAIAKTLTEEKIRHGVGGQINYRGASNGVSVGLSGFYPLQDPMRTDLPITEVRTASVYLLKRFNIPLVRRQVHDLKLTLYVDQNNNNKLDEGERTLPNAFVSVNNNALITDEEGSIKYQNLKPGICRLSFLKAKLDKLVPIDGLVQLVNIEKDEQVNIRFREGKKVEGNIRIISDSLSHTLLTADNFKVIITDTLGSTYHALSDVRGNFYSYLPEGMYTVSLNPEVFDGTDFMPEKMSYAVILGGKDKEFVQFTILQKKRKIRFLKK